MREGESGREQLLREHALTVEQKMLHELAAVDDLERQRRGRQLRGSVQHACERRRELGVGHGVGRGEVDRAAEARVVDDAADRAHLVGE